MSTGRGAMLNTDLLRHVQFIDPAETLGRAVNLLQSVQPFAAYDFGAFTRTLMGQIRRRHYLFTLAEGRPVGYVGWAMCSTAAAQTWLDGGSAPSLLQCENGDRWLGLTWYAVDPQVSRAQVQVLRAQYPGTQAFGIRDYGCHRRSAKVFNRRSDPGGAYEPLSISGEAEFAQCRRVVG